MGDPWGIGGFRGGGEGLEGADRKKNLKKNFKNRGEIKKINSTGNGLKSIGNSKKYL